MTGALTLLIILAVTLAVVRIAGVALRLTGLPQPVARFQSISALTGTGFTTSEAEGTMHHPVRRRILTLLMFTGHLGVVSLASTVILAVTAAQSNSSVFIQILAMLAAIAVISLFAANKTLDVVMCDWVGRVLLRLGWLRVQPFELLYEHPDGHQLCEHIVTKASGAQVDLHIVSLNGRPTRNGDVVEVSKGDRILAYARPEDHEVLAHGSPFNAAENKQ